jgi:hypothetical protein
VTKGDLMVESVCLNCDRSEQEVPLMVMRYRADEILICPQCLPVLIHKPANLAGKLPGAEKFGPAQHEH